MYSEEALETLKCANAIVLECSVPWYAVVESSVQDWSDKFSSPMRNTNKNQLQDFIPYRSLHSGLMPLANDMLRYRFS